MALQYRAIQHNCFPISITAKVTGTETDIAAHRFIGYDGAYAGPAAGSLGVSRDVNDPDDMMVVEHLGVAKVEAGVDFDGTETTIGSDAEGKAVPWANGPIKGYLYQQHVCKAGELTQVILLQNVA